MPMMRKPYCTGCGKARRIGAKYCDKCGEQLVIRWVPVKLPNQRRGKRVRR
jgi:hypothetical protein